MTPFSSGAVEAGATANAEQFAIAVDDLDAEHVVDGQAVFDSETMYAARILGYSTLPPMLQAICDDGSGA